jgi:hypothetical protein
LTLPSVIPRSEWRGGGKQAAAAEQDDSGERAEPGHASPEVDVLDLLSVSDEHGQSRHVEDQPCREEEEEADCVHPVEQALDPREPADVAGLHAPYPFERPTQASWS